MGAGVHDITVDRGVYYEVTFILKDDNGSAINISGYTFKSQIKRAGRSKPEQEFTCAIVNATGGSVRLSMAGNLTRRLPSESLEYDLVAKDSGNNIRKYVEGKVNLRETTTDTSNL
tara:strand:+ start:931 stop:1278 length:348 start_codon:yes stop_codon:yes gene_type:complete